MPFPNYTASECETAIQAVDAQIAKLRSLAGSFSVGSKAFDYRSKLDDLRQERREWVARWEELTGRDGGGGLMGPRIIPTGG